MTTITATHTARDDETIKNLGLLPAAQQPRWANHRHVGNVLSSLPRDGFVDAASTERLLRQIVRTRTGEAIVLQLGDCVENIDSDVYADTQRKLQFIDAAAKRLETGGREVIRVGRIAGQHAKPRSKDFETIDGKQLPSYRGPAVNSPEPTPVSREPSAIRLAHSWAASQAAYNAIADYHAAHEDRRPVWTSHEMLLIDYELNYLRPSGEANRLATTHWPWIGARTRQPDGAHVAIAAALTNPVSVKLDAATSPQEAVALARRLNPNDVPGKLTFISRMGSDHVVHLHHLAAALAQHGSTVQWICDPMHGNTVSTRQGVKTRHIEHIIDELVQFQRILIDLGLHPAGVHLEASPDDIYECAESGREPERGERYTTLLDPRLNAAQTSRILDAWIA